MTYTRVVHGLRWPQLLVLAVAGCIGDGPEAPYDRGPQGSHVPATDPPVLVGAGDIASCSGTGDEATAALLDAIPGQVFTAGDNAYPDGTATDFANCYEPSWGRHKARTHPSPGNHDYHTPGAAGYFAYFGASAGEAGLGYYSYDFGDWHIISLNSDEVDEVAQEQWLRADLAATARQCVLAYWHHPRFSSGSNHGSDAGQTYLWQALYDHGAEVVVSAHDHLYERFARQDPNGIADAERGIREFVVGTGGRSLYSFGPPIANSEVRYNGSFGVLKLTLYSGSYSWEFVPVAGATFSDVGSESCHGGGSPPSNQAPSAAFTQTCSDLTCGFTDQSTDGDGTVVSWNWAFGDGATDTLQRPTHEYSAGGTYSVALTVTDDDGASSTTSHTVTVSAPNQPPVAAFGSLCLALTCYFTDGSTDGDGTIAGWSWAFGDGVTATVRHPVRTYAAAGTYNVTLTVTDNGGAAGSTTQPITTIAATVTLTAKGTKAKGLQRIDLTWRDAVGASVDVYRDGVRIATTANSGTYRDNLNRRGSATYRYQVCEVAPRTGCSNPAVVKF